MSVVQSYPRKDSLAFIRFLSPDKSVLYVEMDKTEIITIAIVVGVIVLILLLALLLYWLSVAKEVPPESLSRFDQERITSPLLASKRVFKIEEIHSILDWMKLYFMEPEGIEVLKVEGCQELLLSMMRFKEKYSARKANSLTSNKNLSKFDARMTDERAQEQKEDFRIAPSEKNGEESMDGSSSESSYSGGELDIKISITPPAPTRRFFDLPKVYDKRCLAQTTS